MLTLLAALLIGQAHVHDAGADSAAMAAQPHPFDPDAPKPKGSMTELKVGVKDKADQLAAQGYLALAIDLYKGKVATDPKQAAQLMQAKDEKWGDQVEAAGLEWLRKNAQGANVAVIGWCMGGGEALKA